MLEIGSLTKSFGAVKALEDISLKIDTGEMVAVIGRSGAGKSTLLRCINMLETPTSGTIQCNDQYVSTLKGKRLNEWRELYKLGMKDQALQRAGTLSGGQQQRVAISRAMMQEPEILLADEPVASLDPRNTHAVMSTLSEINTERGITVLVNLHSIEIAKQYCDRVIGLRDGHLVFDAPVNALTDSALETIYDGADIEEALAPIPGTGEFDPSQMGSAA